MLEEVAVVGLNNKYGIDKRKNSSLIDEIYLHEGKREGKLSIGHFIDDDTDRYNKSHCVHSHIFGFGESCLV